MQYRGLACSLQRAGGERGALTERGGHGDPPLEFRSPQMALSRDCTTYPPRPPGPSLKGARDCKHPGGVRGMRRRSPSPPDLAGAPGFCFGQKKSPICLEVFNSSQWDSGHGCRTASGAKRSSHRFCLNCLVAAGLCGAPEFGVQDPPGAPLPPSFLPGPTSSGGRGVGSWAPRPQTPAHLQPAGRLWAQVRGKVPGGEVPGEGGPAQ